MANAKRIRNTHININPPTPLLGSSPHPQPLVKGVLHIIHLAHLGDNLVGRGEFSVGVPDLRFTIARSLGLRESRRGCHHHLFNGPARSDPCPHILKGLCEDANVIGQLPRRVDVLPAQSISLEGRNQQGIL